MKMFTYYTGGRSCFIKPNEVTAIYQYLPTVDGEVNSQVVLKSGHAVTVQGNPKEVYEKLFGKLNKS